MYKDSLYELIKFLPDNDFLFLTSLSKEFHTNGRSLYFRKYKRFKDEKTKEIKFLVWKEEKEIEKYQMIINQKNNKILDLLKEDVIKKMKETLIKWGIPRKNRYIDLLSNINYIEHEGNWCNICESLILTFGNIKLLIGQFIDSENGPWRSLTSIKIMINDSEWENYENYKSFDIDRDFAECCRIINNYFNKDHYSKDFELDKDFVRYSKLIKN